MNIGFLSDAHGNPLALDICLAHLSQQRVEQIYFLGDAVGYLPGETEVLRLLSDAHAQCQKGNHEAMLLGERAIPKDRAHVYRLDEARQRLSPAGREELRSWPTSRAIEIEGRRILMIHGSPEEPLDGYVYPDDDLERFADLPFDLVVMGNTHRPFARDVGTVKAVNVGSCGLPRDRGDLLAFVIYDSAAHQTTIYRSRLERERVVRYFGRHAVPDAVFELLGRTSAAPVVGEILEA